MSLLARFFHIPIAYADSWTSGLPLMQGRGSYPNFNAYFSDLVLLATIIGGLVAVMMIVYGGILYSKSQGKPEDTNKAKELVVGSLTGLAILLLIRLVVPTLGINVGP